MTLHSVLASHFKLDIDTAECFGGSIAKIAGKGVVEYEELIGWSLRFLSSPALLSYSLFGGAT